MSRTADCLASIAFANAFTKVFIDSDDTKALNKAYKALNEDRHYKRLSDSDYKDLAYIKWTKSAVNLHNNHVGRQMVREATQRRCRCHGLSGVCQFQTCWDQLIDFSIIASRLRSVYLSNITRVEIKNQGTYDKPDLHLASTTGNHSSIDKLELRELVYLYESPDYCEPSFNIGHPGTKGRPCAPLNTTSSINNAADLVSGSSSASCEFLCCSRGYYSELILDMVTCNCRFKFCCQVDCEYCLRQHVQHFCL